MPSLPARTSLRACFHSARALIRSRHRIPCPLACSRAGTIGSRGAGEQGSRGRPLPSLLPVQRIAWQACMPDAARLARRPPRLDSKWPGGPSGLWSPPCSSSFEAGSLPHTKEAQRRPSMRNGLSSTPAQQQHATGASRAPSSCIALVPFAFLAKTRGILDDHTWFPDLSGEAINEGIGLPS